MPDSKYFEELEKCAEQLFLTSSDSTTREVCIKKSKLDQLEAKAAELDRREQGVAIKKLKNVYGRETIVCGKCGEDAYRNYCPECGHRLIWQGDDANE